MPFTNMKTGSQRNTFKAIRRHKLFIPTAIFLVILIIAIPIPIVIGRRKNNNSQDQPSTSQNTPTNLVARPSLWLPTLNTTWQIVLQSPLSDTTNITPDVSVYDLDLFTNSVETFQALQKHGKKIVCYFSGGSYEPNRPDSNQFQKNDQGKVLDGWPNEKWLNLSSPNVRSIMKKRVELAISKGCDAIDPDNVDGYANKNGLGLKEKDSIDFMHFLSDEAKQYNMSIGLKNALSIIPSVLDTIHFAVNEQCAQYNECDKYSPMINKGLPVFHIEYPNGDRSTPVEAGRLGKYCSETILGPSSTVLKGLSLDGFVQYCDAKVASTSTG
jgi:hypothetical protein